MSGPKTSGGDFEKQVEKLFEVDDEKDQEEKKDEGDEKTKE